MDYVIELWKWMIRTCRDFIDITLNKRSKICLYLEFGGKGKIKLYFLEM